jgi:hypothetical protein
MIVKAQKPSGNSPNGLKFWWPGVSSRLSASPSCSKLITAEDTVMPRSRLTAIQSERTRRRAPNLTRQLDRPAKQQESSCHVAQANQFRLFLHAAAYWLLWSMRRVMQFDTLRPRLIKLAARVIELKIQVKIHLPSSAPDQAIFAMLLNRLSCLVT